LDIVAAKFYGSFAKSLQAHKANAKAELGQQFVDWLISPAGQKAIADYKINGEQLQLFFDYWIAALVNQYRDAPLVLLLSFLPDGFQLALLFTFGLLVLVSYRVTSHERLPADRAMFVLGSGLVSASAADSLKLIFGRLRPEGIRQ
jgi:hypothetical protein